MFASISAADVPPDRPASSRARGPSMKLRGGPHALPLRNATERRCHGLCPIVPAHPSASGRRRRARGRPSVGAGRHPRNLRADDLLLPTPGAVHAQPAAKRTQTAKATQDEPASRPIQSIVALVNDEPITGYEIEQRVALVDARRAGRAEEAASQAQVAEHERAVQELRHEAAAGKSAEDGSGTAGARASVAGRVRRQHQVADRERVRADRAQAGARGAHRGAPEAAGGQEADASSPPTTKSTASSAAWPNATR